MRDLGGVVADGPVFESFQRRLDFAEALIDLFRQFLGASHIPRKPVTFSLEASRRRLFVLGQLERRAGKLPQAMGDAIGKAERGLDPFPALGGDLVGGGLELLG